MRSFSAKSVLLIAIILVAQFFAESGWAQYSYYRRHHNHHYFRWNPPDTQPSDTGTSTPPANDPSVTTGTDNGSPTDTGTGTDSGTSSSGGAGSPILSGPPVSDMVLTFADEFDVVSASGSGDGMLWQTRFWYNPLTRSNWENLDLGPEVCGLGLTPYSVNNGILNIHEKKTDPRLTACGVQHPYTSGNINTYHSFWQTYGYFEIRAKASGVFGSEFAFWMLPKDGSWPPEIDLPEVLGNEPNIVHVSNHTGPENTNTTFAVDTGADLSAGFHRYGMLWDENSITYLLDDKPVAKTPTRDDEHKPFFMILGLGVGTCGGWVGCPDDPDTFGADILVDYVRVWQFADKNPGACIGYCAGR